MNGIHPLPGSFRDPSGHVYEINGRIYRTVNECFARDFEAVLSTGLFTKLAERHLLLPITVESPDRLGPIGTNVSYILEAPKLPFISFPYEWSFSALKSAAILHLTVHLQSLEFGVTLSDASAYNIQFRGTQPVFIDHLSFRPYLPGEIWAGHRQFCEQFLNPLLLRTLHGIPHNAWYRGAQEGISVGEIRRLLKWRNFWNLNILTHIVLQDFFQHSAPKDLDTRKSSIASTSFPLTSFKRMLEKFACWIAKLSLPNAGQSTWRDYTRTCSYSPEESENKKQFIRDFTREIEPALVWDLGCNTGAFSESAMEGGAKYVIGFDSDHGALEECYVRATEKHLPFQALFMDLANPSPNQGWNGLERESLQARASADAVLALALVHHLAIARNIPLPHVVNWLIGLAPHGIIEFVPKNDPMVQTLLSFRQDIFNDYTLENFVGLVEKKARTIRTETVSKSGRVLIWFQRR